MIRRTCILIIVLCSATVLSFGAEQDKRNVKPEVYIIGSIHWMHFNPDYHYSIPDLLAQIIALKPDVVCGEITPEAFGQAMEGYFPPEAAFLAQMAQKCNYRFVPVDWRLDYATQTKAGSIYPVSIKEKGDSLIGNYIVSLKESNYKSVYDYIHGTSNLKIIDSLYEQIISPNPITEIAHGSWQERNRRIVENGMAAVKNAHRIVFVFGSDHIPQIQRQLKALGIDAQIPKCLFTPSNSFKVSNEVLERWKRNLENLKLIRDKQIPTAYDNYQKVIHSKRIGDIEEAIKKSSL